MHQALWESLLYWKLFGNLNTYQFQSLFGDTQGTSVSGAQNAFLRMPLNESESERLCCVQLFVTPGTIRPWNSPGQNTGVGSLSILQGIFPTQGLNPGLLHCMWDSLPAEPQGKPKNTGVGSLSLLQVIFPTQKSNPGSPALQVDSLPTELSRNL